jgi:hypothetical protein
MWTFIYHNKKIHIYTSVPASITIKSLHQVSIFLFKVVSCAKYKKCALWILQVGDIIVNTTINHIIEVFNIAKSIYNKQPNINRNISNDRVTPFSWGLEIIFGINVPFDIGLDQLLGSKISYYSLTLFFKNSSCEKMTQNFKALQFFQSNRVKNS